jgi:WD40 repeat protein
LCATIVCLWGAMLASRAGRRWRLAKPPVLPRFVIVLVTSVAVFPYCVHATGNHNNGRAYSIAKSEFGQLAYVGGGRALFKREVGNITKLTVWDISARGVASEVALPDWEKWREKAPESLQSEEVFRFQSNGSKLVALQVPWLVLIDLRNGLVSHRVLASEAYLDPNVAVPDRTDDFPEKAILAVNPVDGSVAVAFNVGKQTTVFVYDADLKVLRSSWSLARYVRGLCWSPEGRTLAVLYAARYDERRQPISAHFGGISSKPDVWLFDAVAGKPVTKFSTGSSENEILFSNNGKKLYAINTWMYRGGAIGWGAIRIFEIPSGKLIQTIRGPKHGLHGHMDLSPDGDLLAADASSEHEDIPRTIVGLETVSKVISRIVVLEHNDGKVIFEHHASIYAYIWAPLHFGFSLDGRLLLVDISKRDGTVDVYSVRKP